MKNGPLLFLGLAVAVGCSWAGLAIGSNAQLGKLTSYYDKDESQAYPAGMPGEAAEGSEVYRSQGCAACHTEQTRRPDYGSDQARGWGDRQSVDRDTIFQATVQLGQNRIGPDLADFGGRKPAPPSADEILAMLYTGQGAMPGYPFLFQRRRIVGQPSANALLPLSPALRSRPGWEIVPTRDAERLVAYLLSLNTSYVYPEARPAPPPAPAKAEGHK